MSFTQLDIIKRCDLYHDRMDDEGRHTIANTLYMAAREIERLMRELAKKEAE